MKFTVLATLLVGCYAFEASEYLQETKFTGKATYYGGPGYDAGTGNCAIRAPMPSPCYEGRLPVAINNEQYVHACGACIEITGKGTGLGNTPVTGKIDAYISDRCYECGHSNLDLSSGGDGIWDIEWKVVPCAPANKIQFQFEGSNLWYYKIQCRGMSSPAVKVEIEGKNAALQQDNHWVVSMDGTKGMKEVKVTTILGQVFISKLDIQWEGSFAGVIDGTAIVSSTPVATSGGDDDDNK